MKIVAAVLASIAIHAAGADLDDPGAKKITIRSEIKRGAQEAFRINPIPGEYARVFSEMMRDNQEHRNDTDGFLLGAYYQHWINCWNARVNLAKLFDAAALKPFDDMALDGFKKFRAKQKELQLTNAQVAEALGEKLEVLTDRIGIWEKR